MTRRPTPDLIGQRSGQIDIMGDILSAGTQAPTVSWHGKELDYPIDRIQVGKRMRPLGDISTLTESISQIGLLNPVNILPDGTLIAGNHRLAAAKALGWKVIRARVVELSEVDAEIAEIDENLRRNNLTVLEESEHLLRREELLQAKGLRAKAGDNQHNTDAGGEMISPPATTAAIAGDLGLSERSAQIRLQIARNLDTEAREAIRTTDLANSTTQLVDLARQPAEKQRTIADLLVSGQAANVNEAVRLISPPPVPPVKVQYWTPAPVSEELPAWAKEGTPTTAQAEEKEPWWKISGKVYRAIEKILADVPEANDVLLDDLAEQRKGWYHDLLVSYIGPDVDPEELARLARNMQRDIHTRAVIAPVEPSRLCQIDSTLRNAGWYVWNLDSAAGCGAINEFTQERLEVLGVDGYKKIIQQIDKSMVPEGTSDLWAIAAQKTGKFEHRVVSVATAILPWIRTYRDSKDRTWQTIDNPSHTNSIFWQDITKEAERRRAHFGDDTLKHAIRHAFELLQEEGKRQPEGAIQEEKDYFDKIAGWVFIHKDDEWIGFEHSRRLATGVWAAERLVIQAVLNGNYSERNYSDHRYGATEVQNVVNDILTPVPVSQRDDYDGDEWYTPADYIEAARKVMGSIDLDPASCDLAQTVVNADVYLTKLENGLSQQWIRDNVWLNPPYSNPAAWIEKATKWHRQGRQAVILVNNATETEWFQSLLKFYPVCFPERRIAFWRHDQKGVTARQGQAIFYLGHNVDAFLAEFSWFGPIMQRRR